MDMIHPGLLEGDLYNTSDGLLARLHAVAVDPEDSASVVRADARSEDNIPCIGFAYRVSGGGDQVSVRSTGILGGLSGIVIGDLYWLDPDSPGGITNVPPEVDDLRDTGGLIQLVGVGTTTSAIALVSTDTVNQVWVDASGQ